MLKLKKPFPVLVMSVLLMNACGQGSHFVDPAADTKAPALQKDGSKDSGGGATAPSPSPTSSATPTASPTSSPEPTTPPAPLPTVTVTATPAPTATAVNPPTGPTSGPVGKPTGSPTQTPGQGLTQNPETCALLAEMIASAEDGAETVTARVLSDGTCVINTTEYAPGTTLEITPVTELNDGTLIFILKDASGKIIEAFYVIDNQVLVTVLYNIIEQNPGLSQPGNSSAQPAPQILLTRQIHFETGKWNILKSQKRTLDVMARAIFDVTQNQGLTVKSIEVQGHTDDVGGAQLNRHLSKMRAETVRAQLLKHLDAISDGNAEATSIFWEQFVIAKGYGPDEPISGPSGRNRNGEPAFTKKDRTLNRRVEIHFNY